MMQIEWFKHIRIKFTWLILVVSLFSAASSFAEDVEIEKASYKAKKNQLFVVVKREGNLGRATLKVYDSVLNKVIAEKRSSNDEVKFRIKALRGKQVPCFVRVEFDGFSATRQVKNAPSDCSQGASIADSSSEGVEFEIEKATYKSEEQRLIVVLKRDGNISDTAIKLYDNVLNLLIAYC